MLCIIEEPGDHSRAEEEVGDGGGGGGGETEGGGEGEERGEVGGGDGGLERGTEEVGDGQPPPPPPPVEAAEVYTCIGTVYTAGNDTEFVRYVDFHDQLRNTCRIL